MIKSASFAFALFFILALSASAAYGSEASAPSYARGEAIVALYLSEDIRLDSRRRELFADYCREVAEAAEAEVLYISPLYESSEIVTATFRSKLETEELLSRLKKDPRVASVSRNHIQKLPRPPKSEAAGE